MPPRLSDREPTVRLPFSLKKSSAKWLAGEAKKLGVSMAAVLRAMVEHARKTEETS